MQPNLKTFTQEVNEGRGASYSLRDGVLNPKEGYMVSLAGRQLIEAWKDDNTEAVRNYVLRYGGDLDKEGVYLGAWRHKEGLCLDTSINVPVLSEALRIGKENDQICVWDCKNQIEIYL